MTAIECHEELSCHVSFAPHVVILAGILVLVVRPSGCVTFFFVEIFQLVVRKFIDHAPNMFRLIGQDVSDATIARDGLKRKCQPVCGQFCAANKLCQWASALHLRPIKV